MTSSRGLAIWGAPAIDDPAPLSPVSLAMEWRRQWALVRAWSLMPSPSELSILMQLAGMESAHELSSGC